VSAWALPRPSAIASARLANNTVNQSHEEMAKMNPAGVSPRPVTAACTKRTVVKRLPTATTNITGFRTITRGSSFFIAARAACLTMAPSKSGRGLVTSDLEVMTRPPSSGGAR